MSTPLLRRMKNRGTTFYAFPSTSSNPNPKFSKFVLLNIPQKKEEDILDFDKFLMQDNPDNKYGIFTNGINNPSSYADQMVESLRNYVANHDVTMRESKINQVKDFYNITEPNTPTEKIFWKWLRKFNAIDFEPAVNKVDWDKNLSDFENPNADTVSNTDYFRKYLWKERETTEYVIESGNLFYIETDVLRIISNFPMKYKEDDYIFFSGVDSPIDPSVSYRIRDVEFDENTNETIIEVVVPGVNGTPDYEDATIRLDYHRLVQYIGEINVQSNVSTASKDEVEVTAYIPHQAGRTPTIMWKITEDRNYYPGVELPLLPEQIQPEIRGAENLNSPIRQNPSDYPGSYNGQFDTNGRTYMASNGDRLRYSGDYYGILLNNNVGLDEDDYVEILSDFNSNNIDGLTLDFNLNHYLKMDITDESVGFNFDEFNQLSIDDLPPEDFEYNAILWYYEVEDEDEDNGTVHNLYGITFLNKPEDDKITPYEKLVQTDDQDGLSYVHVLNLSQSVDNDTSSLSFDPLTLNNTFGFDLYNNVMSNVGKLNESFVNIVNQFVRINTEINNVKSLVYSQVDIDMIKNKLKNLEELLRLYSTYQFVDSDTVRIEQDFSGVYPTLGFNVRSVEYEDIISTTTTDINDYIESTQSDYLVEVPETNKLFLKITNNDITDYGQLNILFDRDFNYKQSATIYIDAKDALFANKLGIWINYDDGTVNGVEEVEFIENVYLPKDIDTFVSNTITYSKTKYMSTSVYQNVNLISFTGTTDTPTARTVLYTNNADMFGDSVNTQTVYVEDLIFRDDDDEIIDYSGIYDIDTNDYSPIYVRLKLDTFGLTPIGIPKIYYYKGIKIDILRIDESSTSSLEDRYLIQKTIL